MKTQHTPGPWRLSKESQRIIVQDLSCIGTEGVLIGSSSGHPNSGFFPTEEEGIANARLIAAAPDLLAALYDALPYVEDVLADKAQLACFKKGVVQKHAAAIRAAIQKAEAP